MENVQNYWNYYMNQDKLFKDANNPAWSDVILHSSPVDGNSCVKKYIIKEGLQSTGKVKDNYVAVLHYTIHIENSKDPIDSTLERGYPLKVNLEEGNLLIGMDIAILSMTKQEISIFVIEHEYAYGAQGIPPRIPPKSRIMLTIEVLDFFKSGSSDYILDKCADGEIQCERKLTFKEAKRAAGKELRSGKQFWDDKDWFAAGKCFTKGIRLLSECPLQDEEEERKQQKLLFRLLLNQANCGLKMMASELTCACCIEALAINPTSYKGLYRFGRAKLLLEDYEHAIRLLKTALVYKPNNKKILKALGAATHEQKIRTQSQLQNFDMQHFSEWRDDNLAAVEIDSEDRDSDSDSERTLCDSFIEDEEDSEVYYTPDSEQYLTPESSNDCSSNSFYETSFDLGKQNNIQVLQDYDLTVEDVLSNLEIRNEDIADLAVEGRRFIGNKLIDLTYIDIVQQWGTLENFGEYLKELLQSIHSNNKQEDCKFRIPVEVTPDTRELMKRITQEAGFRLRLRKVEEKYFFLI